MVVIPVPSALINRMLPLLPKAILPVPAAPPLPLEALLAELLPLAVPVALELAVDAPPAPLPTATLAATAAALAAPPPEPPEHAAINTPPSQTLIALRA